MPTNVDQHQLGPPGPEAGQSRDHRPEQDDDLRAGQYFTYWTPDPARGEGFQPAPITVDGQRTERYDHSKVLNTTWLQPVGRQLKPLVSESVGHANDTPLPAGAVPFTPDGYLREVAGDAVIVSRFRGADPAGRQRWLFVANRSHSAPATSTMKVVPEAVAAVARHDPATGQYVAQPNPTNITVTLPAGGAALYLLTAR